MDQSNFRKLDLPVITQSQKPQISLQERTFDDVQLHWSAAD